MTEDNLAVIDKVISRYIHVNESVCGLGWDDLYQEGAAALCKAAATYDGSSAQFSTYATAVIRNHLLNHCKAVNTELSVPDGVDALLGQLDAADFLADCKRRYTGVALLGVEALEWKVKGLTGADIARLYGAKPNQVGAWISRATQKIRKDIVEKRLPHL